MLQDIRDRATGWVAWVIVILLIIPFALWGINEYFGGGAVANVAIVNDVPISKYEFANSYEREISSRKQRPEGEEAFQTKQAVLDRMIREELLIHLATEKGYRISEEMVKSRIRNTNYFQRDGKFDAELYQRVLKSNGLTPKMYQEGESRNMLISQVVAGVEESGFVTSAELDQFIRLKDRKLDLSYMVLPVTRYQKDLTISDEEITSYYEANKDKFMTQERVKVNYIELDVLDIEPTIEVTDAQLQSLYEEQKDAYQVAEQRQVSHILIEVAGGAKDDAVATALEKAKNIRQQLDEGKEFAELAKEYSDDVGSANLGGDIGVLEKGSMDANFESAAYSLKQGEVSDPVRSTYGFHIIKLSSLKPAYGKSFEEARADVEAQYRQREAEGIFYDRSDALVDLTYENPETLEIASKEMGLKIKESDWFTRQGEKDGVAEYPNVVNAAFSEDALGEGDITRGNNSKLLELQRNDNSRLNPALVLHASNHEPSQLRSLEEVRKEIEDVLREETIRQKAMEEGENLIMAAHTSGDLETLAKDHQLELVKAGYIKRSEAGHDAAIIQQAFSMGSPVSGAIYAGTHLASGEYAIVAITGEQPGDTSASVEQEKKYLGQFMRQMVGAAEVDAMVKTLRKESEITLFTDQLRDDES